MIKVLTSWLTRVIWSRYTGFSQHPLFPSTICELWAWRDCWAIGPLDRNYWALNGPPIHMVVSRSIYLWDSQWAEHITEWILEFAARPLSDVRLTNRASTSSRARYLVSSKNKQGSSVTRRAKSVESKAMFSPQSLEQNGDFPAFLNSATWGTHITRLAIWKCFLVPTSVQCSL